MFGKSTQDKSVPRPSRRVRVLADQLEEAHDVHRLASDPMLGAVTADRFRVSVTRTMWFFLAVGLGFTTVGVHDFLAGHLAPADPMWWGAWLAEPALAGILITLLRWEAAMLSHGVEVPDKPVKYLKRVLLAATLIANVWAAFKPSHGGVSQGNVFFHVVIPLVVFLLAEVMPVIQQRCTVVRDKALNSAPVPRTRSLPLPAEIRPPGSDARSLPAPAEIPASIAPTLGKLPAGIRKNITRTTEEAHAAGRLLTAEDLAALIALPDSMVTPLLTELNTSINHHPVTT